MKLKSSARATLAHLSNTIGLNHLKKLARNKIYVLTYHSIAGADAETETYRTIDEFESDLKFLAKHFNVMSAAELVGMLKRDTLIPSDALIITFDDGLKVNLEMQVPLLKKYDLTATFFLNSAFVDNRELHFERKAKLLLQHIDNTQTELLKTYLLDNNLFLGDVEQSIKSIRYRDRNHLDEISKLVELDFKEYLVQSGPYLSAPEVQSILRDGFSIGAHSIDHPRYAELSLMEQLTQTIGSINDITKRFDLPYRLFAFPYGDLPITNEFYKQIRPHVDIVFGTRGFVNDPIEFSFQRSEVESTQLPIDSALNYRLLTSGLFRLFGMRKIKRV